MNWILFTEVYQEVVQKRDAYIQGEDIFSVAESQKRGSRRKTCIVKNVKEAVQKTNQGKASGSQMVTAMGEQLKRSLQAERTSKPSEEVTSESPQHSSDSDVTSIDLFEPIKKQPFIRKCYFVTSEEEEDTCILPQKEPACQQQPQKVWVELDLETLEALKEMPRLVATMKTALDNISGSSSSGSCSSSGHGDSQQTGRNTGSNDLMFLGNSSVQVSTRLFHRLGNRRMSLFAQELATLIFGKETLAKSTLTGKGKTAETLDPEKVNAIIDTVREKIPGTEVSAIRALLRRKCNNERYTSNVTPH
ncbi:uncharacterized protein LOC117552760 [Gymnodraco acuticeps]|uniref:Uncharacterized protein LOC117552760 n=1 Tax=Gymnodraco acuticeps TaxID=8218 RepID=A0A6P8UWJ9_GYMAC|nr:uncharacterized protein LOC117552760 [Gymnodraco acuticeps]